MEVEDGLRDDLETLRRCTREGNVEGAKQVVFECEKMFKLSFIDQRVNYHMSAMTKDVFFNCTYPKRSGTEELHCSQNYRECQLYV